jgi:electron transport complex protein RnfB
MRQDSATVARLDAVLPQTQCRRCGYPDCESYARAMVFEAEAVNRCPPGGDDTLQMLVRLTGRYAEAVDPRCGTPGPRLEAVIDESWCIGCTKCIQACPVDAIVGAPKRMHVVLQHECTGCELCLPPCPVECIAMMPAEQGPLDAKGWLREEAGRFRARYRARRRRLAGDRDSVPSVDMDRAGRMAVIGEAVRRRRADRTRTRQ